MKNPKRTIVALLATCTALALSGCLDKKVDFSIDNPGSESLSVRIDQTAYDIKPQSAQEISLAAGRHTIESPAIGKLEFIVYAETKGALINPTLSPYVTVSEVYASSDAAAKGFSPLHKTIHIDGVPFKGPFSVDDQLFIDQAWTYGVHEKFPESITTHDRNSKGNIQTKLFAKDSFLAYFETNSGQPGYYAKNKSAQPAPRPDPVPAPVTLPVFTDPQAEAQALPLKTLYADYSRAETADEQLRLRKQYNDAVMSATRGISTPPTRAGAEESKKQNDLVTLTGRLFWTSARVLPRS